MQFPDVSHTSTVAVAKANVPFRSLLTRVHNAHIGIGSSTPLVSAIAMSSRLLATSVWILLFVSAIACAARSEGDSTNGTVPEQFADVEVVATTKSAPLIEDVDPKPGAHPNAPRRGGVMVIDTDSCGIADPAIDTATNNLTSDINLVGEIHAGLTKVVENPETRVVGELAESFQASANGLVYDFVLRKDLKFNDGSRLTASDVKWSWERALRKSTGSSRANDVLGGIKGADAIKNDDSHELQGVKVIDDRHFQVMLDDLRPELPMQLSDPVASVLKRENVADWCDVWVNDEHGFGTVDITGKRPQSLPIGAGPFSLVEYVQPELTFEGWSGAARCILERNNYYWDRAAYLEGVIARVHPGLEVDESTYARQRHALNAGEIDFGFEGDNRAVDGSNGEANSIISVRVHQSPVSVFLALNPSLPPFDDIRFRRALAKTVDIDHFPYNPNRLMPPSISPEGSDVSAYGFDPSGAKSELNGSAYGKSLGETDIAFYAVSFEFLGADTTGVFNSWRDILGVDVDVHEFELPDDQAADSELKPSLEDVHILKVRSSPIYPSPHGILLGFVKAFGRENMPAEFVQIERMLSDAAAEQDDAERQRKYEEIEQHVLDQALAIPIWAFESSVALLVQPWVHELKYRKYPGSAFHEVWLDETAPDRTLPK